MMDGSATEGQSVFDLGHGQRKDGECGGGGMLGSLLAGWRSGGGGAQRRFMDVVGEGMKFVAVREDDAGGRIWLEAADWLWPPLKGAAWSKNGGGLQFCSRARERACTVPHEAR